MGLYNTLYVERTCSNCGQLALQYIQFKFGECGLHEYRLGDELEWGRNDKGQRGPGLIQTYGISAGCRNCREGGGEFVVCIVDNVITDAIADADEANRIDELARRQERESFDKRRAGDTAEDGKVRAIRLSLALSRASLAFAVAFGVFFGGFGLAVTGILLVAFFVDQDAAGASFAGYVMSKGHPWIYVAVAFIASFIGALRFVATLVSNLRFNEGQTNRMIDRWLEKLSRSKPPE